jgi:imidazolonepropionase-like amidohydrolase
MAIAACAGGPEDVAEFDDIFDVRCGVLIDGLGGEPRRDQLVSISGDRIVAVTDVAGSHGDAELDLSSYTCLPGLIDTHVHLASKASDSADMAGIYRRSTEQTTNIAEESARSTLEAGFTTVRNVGDYFPAVVLEVKQRIERGELEGPRVQTAGPYLTIRGGGGDMVVPGEDEALIPAAVRLGVAHGPEDFATKTKAAIDGGAECIKIIASGAVFAFGGVPGEPEMTPEEIAAVVRVAHENGVKVTAHAHGAQSIRDAIEAGVDSIEHASLADDEVIALAAERGVAFSMDVYNGTYTAEVGEELGYPEEFIRKNDETTEAQRIVFEKAYAAGVPILFGTDAAVYPHGLNARQFSVMVERGMAPMDAILSATSVAARHMGLDGDVGALEPGRFGDLIAVRGDPLADISVLEDVEVVILGGTVVKQ